MKIFDATGDFLGYLDLEKEHPNCEAIAIPYMDNGWCQFMLRRFQLSSGEFAMRADEIPANVLERFRSHWGGIATPTTVN